MAEHTEPQITLHSRTQQQLQSKKTLCVNLKWLYALEAYQMTKTKVSEYLFPHTAERKREVEEGVTDGHISQTLDIKSVDVALGSLSLQSLHCCNVLFCLMFTGLHVQYGLLNNSKF